MIRDTTSASAGDRDLTSLRYPSLHHVIATGASTVVLAAMVLLGTLLVDPFGLSPVASNLGGINEIRTERKDVDRQVKPVDVLNRAPRTLIFGSSRIKEGIDPTALDATELGPAYNFGVDFAGLSYAASTMEWLLPKAPSVKNVVIEVYAPHFFDPSPVPPVRTADVLQDVTAMYFSWNAVFASFKTVMKNRFYNGHTHYLHPNGQVEMWPTDMQHDAEQFMKKSAHVYKGSPSEIGEEQFALLDRILAACEENGARCIFVFPPVHPLHLATEWILGRWPLMEEMKRTVTERGTAFDFTLLTPYSYEPLASQMNYWFDVNHFTPPVGSVMLKTIAGSPPIDRPEGFGIRLTHANLPEVLKIWREQMKYWMERNPRFVTQLRITLAK